MARFLPISVALVMLYAVAARAEIGADGICRPMCTEAECTFDVRLNLHASETGLYEVRYQL